MRFSSRASFDLSPNAMAQALAKRRAAGAPVLDLTLSNPTAAGLPYDWSSVAAALGDPASCRYEPAPFGLDVGREAVCAHYAARGHAVEPSRILLTASTSEAYAFAFKLLCDPGDRVLVPTPSYPLFDYLAVLEGVVVDRYPLLESAGFGIDLGALEAAIGPRTRAIVVVSPNNPTGSYLRRAEREAMRALCERHRLVLVCDEVFADYPLRDDRAGDRVKTLVDEADAPTLVLSGLSKIAGLPQLKLGWMVLSGPTAWHAEASARLELIADTYLSVSTPVMRAAPALLRAGEETAAAIRGRTRRNLGRLDGLVAGSPCTRLEVDGGWSAVLRIPIGHGEEATCLSLLEEEGVLVHPGHFFDFPREAYVVLSLLLPGEAFIEGVSRLVRHASRLAQ